VSETLSERRMAQNQVVIRHANQRVQSGFDKLKEIAVEDGAARI